MEGMKNNYKSYSEIEDKMKNVVMENFLDFDLYGMYEFARCEDCNGPFMGHIQAKYSYYRLSSGVRALALALVPSTITDYLALALAKAKSKLSEYLQLQLS